MIIVRDDPIEFETDCFLGATSAEHGAGRPGTLTGGAEHPIEDVTAEEDDDFRGTRGGLFHDELVQQHLTDHDWYGRAEAQIEEVHRSCKCPAWNDSLQKARTLFGLALLFRFLWSLPRSFWFWLPRPRDSQ